MNSINLNFNVYSHTEAFLLSENINCLGRFINVSSVKGRFAVPHDVSYNVTKYAGEAFSDILRREMYKFGVTVSIIEPGHFGGITAMMNKKTVQYTFFFENTSLLLKYLIQIKC